MNYIPESFQTYIQELPDYISLGVSITGCKQTCPNCHSPHLHYPNNGIELTVDILIEKLEKYKKYVNAFIFFGGEWDKGNLIKFLLLLKMNNLTTCLYSGKNSIKDIPDEILTCLDYLKVGPYVEKLGGLASKHTNQKMYDLKNNKIINKKFQRRNNG